MEPAVETDRAEVPASARRRLRADLLLLLAAVIWGSAFAAQRVVAQQGLGAFLFNGLRFWLGAAVLLPFIGSWRDLNREAFKWSALAGFLLFAAVWLQQAGLKLTTAGNAGFITGLYVVLVPLILLVAWRQRAPWVCWLAAGLATAGTYLLSGTAEIRLAAGDGLELACAVVFALHVIVVGKAVRVVRVLPFSVGQYFFCGLFSLVLGLSLEGETLARLAPCAWAVAYVGILSVGVGYTLQAVGQKIAPAADAAIILSLESVFAALFGYVLLSEEMSGRQLLGALLMLSAMILAQVRRPEQPPAGSAA
jgi:drug/metabolite transporter (DMT)-like permease